MAEGNVQLKLQATLDLAFLRAQVASLGQSLKTGSVSVVATLDTKQLQKDIAKLGKEVRININDAQVEAARLRISRLNKSLATLRRSTEIGGKIDIKVSAKASISQREARKVRADVYRGIIEQGGKILLPVGLKPVSQSAVDAFKADLRQKLGSITVNVQANLTTTAVRGGAKTPAEIDAEVAKGMAAISQMGASRMAGGGAGGVTEAARRESLRKSIEEMTVAQLRQIAKQLDVGGVSKLRRSELINKIVADSSIEMVKKFLDPQAVMRGPNRTGLQKVLDTFARGLFQMLGMDPASMRAASRRALPPIDWPAVAQPRQVSIGPSSTGRALPGAPPPGILPGTRFVDQKRLVGDILSPSLKEALRGAANAFVDNIRSELNSAVRSVNVRDLGNRIRQALALPQGQGVAGLLSPGVGRLPQRYSGEGVGQPSWQERAAARTAQAYARSALRGLDVMYEGGGAGRPPAPYGQAYRSPRPRSTMVPYQAGGALVAPPGGVTPAGPQPLTGQAAPFASPLPSGYFAMGQLAANLRGADQYLRQARVPLAGAINELGLEFGEATKQVLLYGTAYKALAFFTDLPRQALDAATALQTFRNQLLAVTGSATNAEASFGFVDNLAARFAVPLQSVREGFVRLYASMAPAGFKAPQIEALFTGISQAAATLGLSKEQVDRVTYAFSQMASKGQLMAEEVTGQLGDVIPGALSIMAEAAGMDIATFKKAMEDGMFTGKAFAAVMANIPTVLESRFGPGAQGAAQTLRGALNTMQNEVQKLYEAFEPLVNEVARRAFPLISASIGDATAAVKAFSATAQGNQGPANMLSSGARGIYDAMMQVAEIAKAVTATLIQLAPTLAVVGRTVAFVIEQIARFVNTPLGGFLANWLLQTALLTAALQTLAKVGLLQALAAIVNFNGGIVGAIRQLQLLILTSRTAQLGLIALGGGLVLTALSSLFQSLEGIYNKMLGIQQAAKNSAQEIVAMSQTEATVRARAVENEIATLRRLKQQTQGITGGMVSATAAEVTAMARAGTAPGSAFTGPLTNEQQRLYGAGFIDPTQVEAAILKLEDDLARLRAQAKPLETTAPTLAPIPPGGGDAAKVDAEARKAADKAKREQERLASQEQQRILAAQELKSELNKLNFEETKTLAEQSLEHAKSMIDAEFSYREARANELQAFELRLEKQLSDARANSAKALQDAMLQMQEARLNVQVAAEKAAAAKAADAVAPSIAAAGAAVMQGLTGGGQRDASRGRSSGPHLHSQAAPGISQAQHMQMVEAALIFPGGRRASSYGLSRGHAGHGYSGLDYLTPQGTPFSLAPGWTGTDMGIQGALGRGMRVSGPGGSFELGHLAGISTGAGPVSGTAFSIEKREEAAANELVIATRQQEISQAATLVDLYNKLSVASEGLRVSFAEAIGTALPVSQMQLENDLLEQRNQLLLAGASEEEVEVQMRRSKAIAQTNSIQKLLNQTIEKATNDLTAYKKQLEDGKISQQVYDIAVANSNKQIRDAKDSVALAAADLDTFNNQLNRTKEINDSMEPQLRIAAALREARDELAKLAAPSSQIITIANGIGSAFSEAFTGLISGASSAREVMANFFKSLSDMFAQMVAEIINQWIKIQVIEGLRSLLSPAVNMFGGMTSTASDIGFGGSFDAGIGGLTGIPDYSGAFTGFATGGIVTGPTLGLVGEGRYNEAIVPLPDGRSIPVDLGGGMGGSTNVVVNVDAKGTKVQGDEPNANQLGRVVSAAVQAELIKQKRPGGLLSA